MTGTTGMDETTWSVGGVGAASLATARLSKTRLSGAGRSRGGFVTPTGSVGAERYKRRTSLDPNRQREAPTGAPADGRVPVARPLRFRDSFSLSCATALPSGRG